MRAPLLTRYMVPAATAVPRDWPTVDEPLHHAVRSGSEAEADTKHTMVERETTDDS